ncbi:MAG: hypothetical protein ACF8XB_22425 [Planctomycetota bacterium JB042]
MTPTRTSLFLSACAGSALAVLLTIAACQSAQARYNPQTGEVDIRIVGDDGKVVTAKGLEAALKQAMQYKQEAQAAGDAAAAADWSNIINNILDKKGKTLEEVEAEAHATGTVNSMATVDGDEWLVWTWDPDKDPDPTFEEEEQHQQFDQN